MATESKNFLKKCCQKFEFKPELDCFANRLNTQVETYASFKPDPFATFIDAFSFNWHKYLNYIFPPFSLIPNVLAKLRTDQAMAMIVVPDWPTQSWYTTYMEMLIKGPIIFKPHTTNLILPQDRGAIHPLSRQLTLMVGILSGKK